MWIWTSLRAGSTETSPRRKGIQKELGSSRTDGDVQAELMKWVGFGDD